MKRLIPILAALAALSLAAPAQGAVRVMTWNIAGGPSNDLVGPRAAKGVPFNLDHVRQVVQQYNPDVLSLQEACTWQADALGAALGYTVRHVTTISGLTDNRPGASGNCEYGNELLTRTGFPSGGFFRTDLLDPRGCKSGGLLLRVAECRTHAGVVALADGDWVRTSTVHVGSDEERFKIGNQDTEVALVVDDASRMESTAIMAGDFNIPPEDPRFTPNMSALGYTDAGGAQPGQECTIATGCQYSAPGGGAFGEPFLKGDYIYYRGYRPKPGGLSGPQSGLVNGAATSDHKPLVADLETTNPVLTLTAPEHRSATASNVVTISGAVSNPPAQTLRVRMHAGPTTGDRVMLDTVAVPRPDGAWSVSSGLLFDGTYTVRAEMSASVHSSTNTFVVDHSTPGTQVTDPPSTKTDATPTFNFVSSEPDSYPYEPPPRFECSLDGAPLGSCFSPIRYSGIADGNHSFRVRSTDAAGNLDVLGMTVPFVADAVLPTTAITTKPPGTQATGAFIVFQSSEADSKFECSFDGRDPVACRAPKIYGNLAPGNHRFTVRATDAFGNEDPRGATIRWKTAPVLRTLALTPTRFRPRVKGRRGGGAVFTYRLSGKARVRLVFERAARGQKAGAACVARKRATPPTVPGCVLWLPDGSTLTGVGSTAVSRFSLNGRLGGKNIAPGRYRVVATPIDALGLKGRPRSLRVTVTKPPKPPAPKKKPKRTSSQR